MRISEEEDQIQSYIYPSYPKGCSPQEFIAQYAPLIEALQHFDQSTGIGPCYELSPHKAKRTEIQAQSKGQEEETEHITMMLIRLLNESCSHCHRKQYSEQIFSLLGQFKGNLKNLAIGKVPIRISYWDKLLQIESATSLYYSIKQQELLAIYDEFYQQLHYVPHRQTFLINYAKIMMAQHRFQNILKSTQNSLPLNHQLYLAIIAAATYGCKYLWSRSVAAFLKAGGDQSWIQIGSAALPPLLRQMSNFSTMVAYNFKQLYKEKIFDSSNSSQNEYRLLALIWLCYYQALACIDLVCGFIPEKEEYFSYLPNLPTVRPSLSSFEAVKHTQGMGNVQQIRAAEQFSNLYSWDNEDEENIKIKIEGARTVTPMLRTKRVESPPQIRNNEIFILGRVEQQQIFQKISNLQSLRYLKAAFDKYVNFQPLLNHYTNRGPTPLIEDSLVLASDWDFELKGLNKIQLILGSKVRHSLQSLISELRVQNNQKSKQLKHYYQFFNNYMYEYQSYTKIMKSITINQKNYLKLVTKSPFLFTDQAFLRMKNDLAKVGIDALDFLLQAVSFKLQLSINLLSFVLDNAAEEQ